MKRTDFLAVLLFNDMFTKISQTLIAIDHSLHQTCVCISGCIYADLKLIESKRTYNGPGYIYKNILAVK